MEETDAGEFFNGPEAAPKECDMPSTKGTRMAMTPTGNPAENQLPIELQKDPMKDLQNPDMNGYKNPGTGIGQVMRDIGGFARGIGNIATNFEGTAEKMRQENERRNAIDEALEDKLDGLKVDLPKIVANAFRDSKSRAKNAMDEVADKIETVGGRVLAMLETKLREFEALELSDYLPPVKVVWWTLIVSLGNMGLLLYLLRALKDAKVIM